MEKGSEQAQRGSGPGPQSPWWSLPLVCMQACQPRLVVQAELKAPWTLAEQTQHGTLRETATKQGRSFAERGIPSKEGSCVDVIQHLPQRLGLQLCELPCCDCVRQQRCV